MLRYLSIAPLSLFVVMVFYLGMHGLLNQQQTIEFKENDSEFVFSPFTPSVALDLDRPFILNCNAGKHILTKAELWHKTMNVLSNNSVIISCPGYVSPISNYSNVQDVSKAILNELIPKDPFATFEETQPKPPYNQKLALSWMPPIQYPLHTRAEEGWVKLEIMVSKQGTVDNIHVIAANPPRVFDRTAIRAYKKAKFLPEIINGKAVAKTIIQRVDFKLAED